MTTETEKNVYDEVTDHQYDNVYKSKASINYQPGRD